MARDGSGVMSIPYSDFVNGTTADADQVDANNADIVAEITNSIAADGQTNPTANLPMATYRHTGVGNAAARTDYAAAGQVQDGSLNWVDGGGTADAITATYSPAVTALIDGQFCFVRATAANATTTPTFSPNGLTARTIVKTGGNALAAGDIVGDGHELALRYDLANTRWELLNPAAPDVSSYITASSSDTLTNKTFDANGTGNSLSNVDVADLANGTDGELITWDAAGAPATVAVGSSGQVLTSNGAGAAPTFQSLTAGKVLQRTYSTYATNTDLSTAFPIDDTIPQNTEGTEIVTQAITPTDATSRIRIRFQCYGGSAGANAGIGLFVDSTANALAATCFRDDGGGTSIGVGILEYEEVAASTNARTYKIRVGPVSGSARLNGSTTGRFFGGVSVATLIVEEIEA